VTGDLVCGVLHGDDNGEFRDVSSYLWLRVAVSPHEIFNKRDSVRDLSRSSDSPPRAAVGAITA
jgi:hypothetical protein